MYGLVTREILNFGTFESVFRLEDQRDTDAGGDIDSEITKRYDDAVVVAILPSFKKEDDNITDGVVDKMEMLSHTYDEQGRVVRYNYTTVSDETDVEVEIQQVFYDERGNAVLALTLQFQKHRAKL